MNVLLILVMGRIAGVSHGALYAHFTSKADLLASALRTHRRHQLAGMFAARRDEDVARPMRAYVAERADWLAGLMRLAPR